MYTPGLKFHGPGAHTLYALSLFVATGSWLTGWLIDAVIPAPTVQNRPHMVRQFVQSVPPDQHSGQLYTLLPIHRLSRSYLLSYIRCKGCPRITFWSGSYAYLYAYLCCRDSVPLLQVGGRPQFP